MYNIIRISQKKKKNFLTKHELNMIFFLVVKKIHI